MTESQVDSRWWYWVAAVPVITAFWLASALWVVVVVLLVPEANATATSAVISIPAVALGVPAFVAFLVLPLALLVDARAVRDAGADWPTAPARPARLAAGADVVILVGVLVFFEVVDLVGPNSTLTDPLSVTTPERLLGATIIITGVVAGSWLCVRYLRERRTLVSMPGSLREWRRELSTNDAAR